MTSKQPALILASGGFNGKLAKTAFGLIRSSERFQIVGVLDPEQAGQEAGRIVDGKDRGIGIYASVAEAYAQAEITPEVAIIGVAIAGGKLNDNLRCAVTEALRQGLMIVNGLHSWLAEDPEIVALAQHYGGSLLDLRKPRSREQLRFWCGGILDVKAPRIVVMGTDCALGKRTTARWLRDACQAEGIKTELIYTGQTGWMQSAHDYGFILDATPNDFVSGELEGAIMRCDHELAPQLILIEGQSALRNPSGPCGAEFLLSAQAKGVILQHAPARELYKTTDRPWPMADIADDIKIIQLYGSKVLAVTLNADGIAIEYREGVRVELEQRLGLPVFLPLEQGVSNIVSLMRDFVAREVQP